MRVVCEVCETPMNSTDAGVVHKVIGWIAVKNGRAGGSVIRPSAPLGFAHKICAELGHEPREQNSLF
jgi:hypothetical protein